MRTCKRCEIDKDDTCFSKRNTCKQCQNEICRIYKQNNKEKISQYNKEYKQKNKDDISNYNKNYNIENRKTIQDRHTKYLKDRRKTNPQYKISLLLRNRMKKTLKYKQGMVNKLIGCDKNTLMSWLETNFIGDMTWENQGKLWHIDHVIPCKMFNLEDENQQRICFNWSNMRPLYALENLKKKDTLYCKDLLNHSIKVYNFSKQNNITGLQTQFIVNLTYTKDSSEKRLWRLGN